MHIHRSADDVWQRAQMAENILLSSNTLFTYERGTTTTKMKLNDTAMADLQNNDDTTIVTTSNVSMPLCYDITK